MLRCTFHISGGNAVQGSNVLFTAHYKADRAYSRQRHGMQYHVSHVLTTACFERYTGNLSGGILLFCCSVVRGSFHITGSSILVLKLTFSPDPFPRNLPL